MVNNKYGGITSKQDILKNLCDDFPNRYDTLFVGLFEIGTLGFYAIEIYSTNDKSNGLPRYATGLAIQYTASFTLIGCSEYDYYEQNK